MIITVENILKARPIIGGVGCSVSHLVVCAEMATPPRRDGPQGVVTSGRGEGGARCWAMILLHLSYYEEAVTDGLKWSPFLASGRGGIRE
jgi:hypothetical protein